MGFSFKLSIIIGIVVVLSLGLYITNIVFSFKYKTYELENDSIIKTIDDQLNSQFIYEFSAKTYCSSWEEKLNLGTWDGSLSKCNCGGNIVERECMDNETNCKDTKGLEPKSYTVFNGNEICVSRKGDKYKDLIKSGKIINNNQTCSETDKSCGIVDTLDRKLCVDKNQDCPINIHNINKIQEKLFISNNKLDNNNKMYLSEENDEEKIISLIKLSDGYPCLRIEEKNWKAYHPDEKVKSQTCSEINGQTTDNRYTKFDNYQTRKIQLYQDNKLDDYITEEMRNDYTNINLYGGVYYGMDLNKYDFNYDTLKSLQKLPNDCNYYMKIFSYILLGTLIAPFTGGVGACANGSEGKAFECFLTAFLGLVALIVVIGFLADFVLCIIICVNVQRIRWNLLQIANISDEFTNVLVKEVISKYSANFGFSISLIIILILLLGLGIITFILYRKENRYKSLVLNITK